MSLLLDALKRAEKAKQDKTGEAGDPHGAHVLALESHHEERLAATFPEPPPQAREESHGTSGSQALHREAGFASPALPDRHAAPASGNLPGSPRGGRVKLILGVGLLFLTTTGTYYAWALYTTATRSVNVRPELSYGPSPSISLKSQPATEPSGGAMPVVEASRMLRSAREAGERIAGAQSAKEPPPSSDAPESSQPQPDFQAAVASGPASPEGQTALQAPQKEPEGASGDKPAASLTPRPAQPAVAERRSGGSVAGGARSSIRISRSKTNRGTFARLGEAYQAFRAGDSARARKLYRAVLARQPENRDALLGLAAVSIADRQPHEAYRIYLDLLRRNPRDPVALAALAAVQGEADPVEAESRLKSLMQGGSGAPYLQFALGTLYAYQSRWTDAEQAFFDAYQGDPGNKDYAYNLAVSLDHLGKGRAALTYYRRALETGQRGVVAFDRAEALRRVRLLEQHLVDPGSP